MSNTLNGVASIIEKSWSKIAPFWPLKNLIAVNPLHGFEDMPIEHAIHEGAIYFQQPNLPEPMYGINRATIKWLQAFLDEGQATIFMPLRTSGFYEAWRQVAYFDDTIHMNNHSNREFIKSLSSCSTTAVSELLGLLQIPDPERELFLVLMLSTLPGWAAHIKYRTDWSGVVHKHEVSKTDFLAVRLATTYLLWPNANKLLSWHQHARENVLNQDSYMKLIHSNELSYRKSLLESLAHQATVKSQKFKAEAQLVFCIDVRSEPFRRALESKGNYDTYGFAGFFGVPIKIEDAIEEQTYASCPALLSPKHTVCRTVRCEDKVASKKFYQSISKIKNIKKLYQSLKYTFTTPFFLVEVLGLLTGIWMGLNTFFPRIAYFIKLKTFSTNSKTCSALPHYSLNDISFEDQCTYAESALKMIGLTSNFAPLVVLCGHGSLTQNNSYATALDCGACGGRHGEANAYVLSTILNCTQVRAALTSKGISIPATTHFIPAEHNTTTDEVILITDLKNESIHKLSNDLKKAKEACSLWRCKYFSNNQHSSSATHTSSRSKDWAQVRPEWGLARNAAFIIGPSSLTKNVDFQGRAFMHSYDHTLDPDGSSLKTILTAPMVVAQWINTQYLFSTLDNVAYGSGSKITENVTGKIGTMQGNASDLMNGLPLQSVYSSDDQTYHEPQRLMTVVYAPRTFIDKVIAGEEVLHKLFKNGWVTLACIEPASSSYHILSRELTWINDL